METLTNPSPTLRQLVASVPQARLTQRPQPNKWSIAEIIAHLADDEIVLAYRVRSVLANSGCAVAGFDQDRWAEVVRYSRIPAAQSIDRFDYVRAWNLALFEQLTEEEWSRYGIHSERGRETIREMASFYALHDRKHIGQIERIVNERPNAIP